jgi:TRAP-type C4-dicarboxylate transport system permease small subunit
MSPPSTLVRVLKGIERTEIAITVSAFAVMIVVIFADVVVRRVTGSGLVWAREVGVFANIVLSIVGIGLASARGAHLRPHFVDSWVPKRWDPGMRRIQELLTAVAFGVLAWLSWQVVSETRELQESSTVLRWPVWIFQGCLPLAFCLATIRHLLFALVPSLRPREESEADLVNDLVTVPERSR